MRYKPNHYLKYRLALLISMGLIVLLGLLIKFYQGPGQDWLNNSLGGVPYEIFWILLIAWGWPRVSPLRIAIAVVLATCGLEFLQLWRPAWLTAVRSLLIGRLILGTSFSGSDFPYYFLGGLLGWIWVRQIRHYWYGG